MFVATGSSSEQVWDLLKVSITLLIRRQESEKSVLSFRWKQYRSSMESRVIQITIWNCSISASAEVDIWLTGLADLLRNLDESLKQRGSVTGCIANTNLKSAGKKKKVAESYNICTVAPKNGIWEWKDPLPIHQCKDWRSTCHRTNWFPGRWQEKILYLFPRQKRLGLACLPWSTESG